MNCKKNALKKDIEILNKILFPKSQLIVVFDSPKKRSFSSSKMIHSFNQRDELMNFINSKNQNFTFVNFSSESFGKIKNNFLLEGILDFSNVNNSTFTKYYFINNPDGSMRWIFPKGNSTPCFLNLYNGSGLKAELFVLASKVLNKLNYLKPIVDGQFSVFFKNDRKFKISFDDIPFDDFAIFTGTIGENRKAIISLSKNKSCTHFIKIPLTDASLDLVKNEYQQLTNLGKFKYATTIFPNVKFIEDQIVVSNVLPMSKDSNQSWSSTHWNSLNELYRFSYRKKPLEETPFWKTINDGITFLQQPISINNGLIKMDIEKLKEAVEQLYYSINSTKTVSLGIGHGDFTPWNMYVGKDKLHVYDWEMSQHNFPLLFDFYHYFFQKGILIDQEKFSEINRSIQSQLTNENALDILKSFKIEKEKHFQLYLLYIVCYYLPKYLSQPKLHHQVHWLVSTWTEALQSFARKVEVSNA